MLRAFAVPILGILTLHLVPGEACLARSTTAGSGHAEASVSTEHDALETAVQGVVYGLPLVLMDLTRKNFIDSPKIPVGLNQFAHLRTFPTASFKQVVRANVDTLYSSAFLDLSREPIVLSVPDTEGRYYLMPMLDAWTNVFASPGERTTGTAARNFAITGPGWRGTLPAGVQELKSPTNMAWILGRTETNGPSDYPAVHAIQDGYKLVPLSSFGRPYAPPPRVIDPTLDTETPPIEQIQKMSAVKFFGALAQLLSTNPPPASDAPMLAKLATIGVVPGKPFDPSRLDPSVAKTVDESLTVALNGLQDAAKTSHAVVNGWSIPPMSVGNYGSDYKLRAVIALIAFGANLPSDSIYPTSYVDADGRPLDGAYNYRLHFAAGQTPPVRAFWSVTAYDPQSFFIANPLDRYAVSSWMPLTRNADGSVDIYIQHDSPGAAEQTNWLPVADGDFNVTLRMYWPDLDRFSAATDAWKPPAIERL